MLITIPDFQSSLSRADILSHDMSGKCMPTITTNVVGLASPAMSMSPAVVVVAERLLVKMTFSRSESGGRSCVSVDVVGRRAARAFEGYGGANRQFSIKTGAAREREQVRTVPSAKKIIPSQDLAAAGHLGPPAWRKLRTGRLCHFLYTPVTGRRDAFASLTGTWVWAWQRTARSRR